MIYTLKGKLMSNLQNKPNPQCEVIKGKNGKVQIEIISEKEALKYCPKNYTLVVDRVRMIIFIQNINNNIRELNGNIKHLGSKSLGLLKKLMYRQSIFLTPYEIGNVGEYDVSYFIKDNLIQYSRRLRNHLFGECGSKIIQTASKPYRLSLSGDISFCWIEPEYKGEQ